MLTCAVIKFSSASCTNNTSGDLMNQLTGLDSCTDKSLQSQRKIIDQESADIYAASESDQSEMQGTKNKTLKNYKINDTVRLEGVQITLTDVQKKLKIDSNDFAPKQGCQFVKVKVRIENISVSDLNVSENDIKIKDSLGAVENPVSATYTLDDQFESATLISGGIREGAVIFEVPENDDRLTLIYQEPISNGTKVEFNL